MKMFLRSIPIILMTSAPALAGCPHGASGVGFSCATRGFGSPVLYFLTLGLGYGLLRLAEKEDKKLVKTVGRVVSWIVLVGSLMGLLCKGTAGLCRAKCANKAPSCHTSAAVPPGDVSGAK